MYAIFTNTLLTDKGKSLVSQHEGDYNAPAIHKELLTHILTLKCEIIASLDYLCLY